MCPKDGTRLARRPRPWRPSAASTHSARPPAHRLSARGRRATPPGRLAHGPSDPRQLSISGAFRVVLAGSCRKPTVLTGRSASQRRHQSLDTLGLLTGGRRPLRYLVWRISLTLRRNGLGTQSTSGPLGLPSASINDENSCNLFEIEACITLYAWKIQVILKSSLR